MKSQSASQRVTALMLLLVGHHVHALAAQNAVQDDKFIGGKSCVGSRPGLESALATNDMA
jgi:hypothetical protein